MSKKIRLEFRPKRVREGEWQIEAHFPDGEIRIIAGLTSHEDVRGWIDGSRKIAWLKSQGLAK